MRGLWGEAWKERGREAAAGLLQRWRKTGGLQLEGRREREDSLAYIILSNF